MTQVQCVRGQATFTVVYPGDPHNAIIESNSGGIVGVHRGGKKRAGPSDTVSSRCDIEFIVAGA